MNGARKILVTASLLVLATAFVTPGTGAASTRERAARQSPATADGFHYRIGPMATGSGTCGSGSHRDCWVTAWYNDFGHLIWAMHMHVSYDIVDKKPRNVAWDRVAEAADPLWRFNGWTGSVHTNGNGWKAWDIQGEFQSCITVLCVTDNGHIYSKITASGITFNTYSNEGQMGRCPCG